jgi:DNA polymerase-3 subunit epsilon/ATP-dependent DNA helicase DinG
VPNIYVALDLETTGLDPERDAIIEIGAVKFRGDQVLETFESLVDPARPIPYNIQKLTGIKPDAVRGAPPLASVLPSLHRLVGTYPIVGHNIGFDVGFLSRHGLFKDNPAIDTFELASILLPHAGRYNLGRLTQELGIQPAAEHRALSDAQSVKCLFNALLDQAGRLDLSLIQAVNRMAARSKWSLRPVFADLEQLRSRTVFTSSLGQQLAAKGSWSLAAGGRKLLRGSAGEDREVPLCPAAAPRPLDIDELAAMLEESGLFSQKLPNFEHRPQQVAMLRRVAEALNGGENLMIEAGTGTGKSIAYLLPAAYWAVLNGQRVLISTHTINLQDQLLTKDIPDLQQILPIDFKAVALKGRTNYVCPQRVRQFQERLSTGHGPGAAQAVPELELRVLARVLVWLTTTLTGDRQEVFLPTAAENAVWNELCSDPDLCPAERCRKENCFFQRARQAAESAHLIVVNHALLLADVAAENRVLPEYHYLIIDEAHHLEDSVTQQLSFEADQRSLERMLSGLSESSAGRRHMGLLNGVSLSCRKVPEAAQAALQERLAAGHDTVGQARRAVSELFNAVSAFVDDHAAQGNSQYDRRLRLTPAVRRQPAWDGIEVAWDNLSVGLGNLSHILNHVRQGLERLTETHTVSDFEGTWRELTSSLNQVETTHLQMKSIFERKGQGSDNAVTWVEINANTQVISLHAAPLHVGELVRRHLFDAKQAVVLTSATLFTEQSSDFLRERLGAQEISEAAVGSPFDYRSATLLYLPKDIPLPNQPEYQRALEVALIDLVRAMQGRTLVLFTAYSHLKNTARAIQERLAQDEILVLEQGGGGSRAQLLERFKTTERCVLLGTRSFWEGIDVVGEKLSCVAIVKLPFSVPDDPVFAARSETYEDGFSQYSLPEAILRFRQGFGRLIRTRTDRGVVVCFDKRLLSKQYGEAFIRSLPRCTEQRAPLADLPRLAKRWIDEGKI